MFRRFLFLLAIVVLVGVGTHAIAATFPDVQGTVYQSAFAYLSERNVVHGYPSGEGKPNGYLNRAEALKVVLSLQDTDKQRVEWYKTHMPPLPLFRDSDQRAWYGPYVELAFERGIVTGYPDGTFRPGNILTVEEAITLLMRSYNEVGTSGGAQLSQYIQNKDAQWFTPYINAAVARNLVMHRGTLALGAPITRGQFFDIAYRLHVVRSTNVVAYNGVEPVSTVSLTPRTATTPAVSVGQPSGGGTISVGQPSGGAGASEQYFAISAPSVGINDLAVIHPEDPFSQEGVLAPLQHGVGHLFSYPGNGGKVMIYGHSSGYPWDVSQYTKIFRKINELKAGDRIYIAYQGQVHTYEVTHEQAIAASDTTPFNDNGTGEELILYTCWPPDSISQRYLVHAVPVSSLAAR